MPTAELISFRYLSLKEYIDRLQTEANNIIDETRRLKETHKTNYAVCSELIGFLGFDGLGISMVHRLAAIVAFLSGPINGKPPYGGGWFCLRFGN